MTKDRSLDRHRTSRHIVTIPDGLWQALGEHVGDGQRSELLRELAARFVAGAPMPRRGQWPPTRRYSQAAES